MGINKGNKYYESGSVIALFRAIIATKIEDSAISAVISPFSPCTAASFPLYGLGIPLSLFSLRGYETGMSGLKDSLTENLQYIQQTMPYSQTNGSRLDNIIQSDFFIILLSLVTLYVVLVNGSPLMHRGLFAAVVLTVIFITTTDDVMPSDE